MIARPDHDDPEGGVGIDAEGGWSWVDYTATGSTEHVYQVKALTDQGDSVRFHQSTNGGLTEAITTRLDRVWVIRGERGQHLPSRLRRERAADQ